MDTLIVAITNLLNTQAGAAVATLAATAAVAWVLDRMHVSKESREAAEQLVALMRSQKGQPAKTVEAIGVELSNTTSLTAPAVAAAVEVAVKKSREGGDFKKTAQREIRKALKGGLMKKAFGLF